MGRMEFYYVLYSRYINSISWSCLIYVRMNSPVLIPIFAKGKCVDLSLKLPEKEEIMGDPLHTTLLSNPSARK